METINDNGAEAVVIDAEDISEVPALPTAEEGKTIDWKAEAEKYQGMATRRGTKLAKFNKTKPSTEEAPANKTKKGEFDYGQKAFLISNGVKEVDDIAFVQKMVNDTGKSIEEVLSNPFTQSELKRIGEERATKAATPSAEQGRNGAPARDTVEFWLNKGELPPADQTELRQKVVNAKIAKGKTGSNFSSTPVVGG